MILWPTLRYRRGGRNGLGLTGIGDRCLCQLSLGRSFNGFLRFGRKFRRGVSGLLSTLLNDRLLGVYVRGRTGLYLRDSYFLDRLHRLALGSGLLWCRFCLEVSGG